MILVFIFLSIIIFLSFVLLMLMMSSIKIKIKELNITNFKSDNKYKIYFQIYLLDKLKILSIKIDSNKVYKISKSNRFNMIKSKQISKLLKDFKHKNIKLKNIWSINRILNIKLEKLNLKLKIGIDNVIINSYIITLFSTIISTILTKNLNNKSNYNNSNNSKDLFYYLIPDYNNKVLKMHLDCIISIKIVHIILVIYKLKKEGRGKNGRTSYRRSYVSSYGFN